MYISNNREKQLRDQKLFKDIKKNESCSVENPENNIISRIIEDIRSFVVESIDKECNIAPSVRLINSDDKSLDKEYLRLLPGYINVAKKIEFTLAYDNLSFSCISDDLLVFILAHEYGHHITNERLKCIDDTFERLVVGESMSDYFAGYFSGRSQKYQKSIMNSACHFLTSCSRSLSGYYLEDDKDIFYSIAGDEHGVAEHRVRIFRDGFYNGSTEYFQDIENFIPKEIIRLP